MEEDLLNLLKLLREKRVKYAVHDGFAVGYYSEPRATRDVDLIVLAKDIPRVQKLLPEMYREGERYVLEMTPLYVEIWEASSDHDLLSLKRRKAKRVMIGGRRRRWSISFHQKTSL